MSLIIAAKDGPNLIMMGDRIICDGHDNLTTAKRSKIAEVKTNQGSMLIGFAGTYRLVDIAHYLLREPPLHDDGASPEEYMAVHFSAYLKDVLQTEGWDQKEGCSWACAIAYQGLLFDLTFDTFGVTDTEEDLVCIGAGLTFGYGAMYMGLSLYLPVKSCIHRAMILAARQHAMVRGPFDCLEMDGEGKVFRSVLSIEPPIRQEIPSYRLSEKSIYMAPD